MGSEMCIRDSHCLPDRPAWQTAAAGRPGRRRQDGTGQERRRRHRARTDPAPVLRRAGREQGALRMGICQAVALHPAAARQTPGNPGGRRQPGRRCGSTGAGRGCLLLDAVLDDRLGSTEQMPVRNVCAKISSELADRLDNLCSFLSISKRRFIEAAIIDALEKSGEIIREEGVNEHLAEQESRS